MPLFLKKELSQVWVILGRKWGEVCVKSYNMIKAKVRIMVCCGRRSVIVCGQGGFGSRKVALPGELMMQVRQVLVWWQVMESCWQGEIYINIIKETYHPEADVSE